MEVEGRGGRRDERKFSSGFVCWLVDSESQRDQKEPRHEDYVSRIRLAARLRFFEPKS